MAGALLVLMPLVLGVLALVVVVGVIPHRRRRVAVDELAYPGLRALRAKTSWARTTGIALGVLSAWAVSRLQIGWTAYGRGLMIAPIVFGVVLLLVVTAGDVLAHGDARSEGRRASAAEESERHLARTAPLPLTLAVVAVTLLLTCVLGVGWALGDTESGDGPPGRALSWTSPDGAFGGGSGPWPGPFYGGVAVPAVLLLATVLAAALVVTRSRPRDGSDPEISRVDSIIRRRETETLVAAAGVSISALTFGLTVTAASALMGLRAGALLNGFDPGLWYDVGGWVFLLGALVTLVVGVWCAISLLVPGPATPRGRREAAVTGRKVHA